VEEIKGILQFMVEIEQLKDVHRQTKPVGLDRYENSAEHSWHVCLSALMLKDYANEEIDITRVMKMLLIHDLGEIDAGDTIIYASETEENKLKERNCVERLLKSLPSHLRASTWIYGLSSKRVSHRKPDLVRRSIECHLCFITSMVMVTAGRSTTYPKTKY